MMTVHAAALSGRGDVTLYIPEACTSDTPVAVLLHGVYGSHWNWVLHGHAHTVAQGLIAAGAIQAMVLAMPSDGLWGSGSGYVAREGRDYGAWVAEAVVQATQAVTGANGPLFIAGLSMGGFGALALAARYPNHFAGAVGHSSVTSLPDLERFVEEPWATYPDGDLGTRILGTSAMPPFQIDCGLDDPLLATNRALHERLAAAGMAHGWAEHPGGHDWAYWHARLPETLRFFNTLASR